LTERPTYRSQDTHPGPLDLLRGGRPFQPFPRRRQGLIPHHPIWCGRCRFCSVADPLGPPGCPGPPILRRGDFPQRPFGHRQPPSPRPGRSVGNTIYKDCV